jgi:propionyl-CoA carboxylase alpha chain/3-methylcrotonyl-CoA carboxylase alpha subunit/acetyl-CoA/propionyl-CoA carboxylase biotin carboxyl carrier protein
MNTRLQVEHPVTEWVLGLDLVAEQLRIAAGGALPLTQDRIRQVGHAIECRICAEQPERDFRPATGRVGVLRVPQGENLRFDGGIVEGQAITPAFDSMLAKLIARGATRSDAIDNLAAALRDLVLLGVPTNIDYLRRVLEHPEFRAGRLHTGFLSQFAAQLAAPAPGAGPEAVAIVAAALADPNFRRIAFEVPELHASIGHWRN